MTTVLASHEFEHALQALQSITESTDKLFRDSDNPICESQARKLLGKITFRKQNLEKCRSTAKNVTFNYADALPVLDTASDMIIDLQDIVRDRPIPTETPTIIEKKKTPPLQLSKFAGDITKYTAFTTAFHATTARYSMSKAEKLYFLTQHLEGEPASLLYGIQITNENYEKAWETLDKWYANNDQVISALYNKLENLPPVRNQNSGLRAQYIEIESMLCALQSHAENVYNQVRVRDLIMKKYPASIIQQICIDELPSLKELQEKINKYLLVRERVDTSTNTNTIGQNTFERTSSTAGTQKAATAALLASSAPKVSKPIEKTIYCAFCEKSNSHYSTDCKKYSTANERKQKIKGHLCFNCITKGHSIEKCRSQKPCFYCRQRNNHHSSLCPIKFPEKNDQVSVIKPEASTNLLIRNMGSYLTACTTVKNRETGRSSYTRLIFDCACPETLVLTDAVEHLQLKVESPQIASVKGFLDKKPKKFKTATTQIYFPTLNRSITAQTTPEIATNIRSIDHNQFLQQYPQYAQLNFADEGNDREPAILIGSDYFFSFFTNEPKIPIGDDIHLVETLFGWIIAGPTTPPLQQQSHQILLATTAALDRLNELDALGIRESHLTKAEEEESALLQFYNSIELINNRYEIGWPWRINPAELPTNYGLAFGRLRTLYKRLAENSEVLQAYDNIFRAQLDAGILEPVIDRQKTNAHYIPHQAVIHPEKSTALRIVFDASSKTNKSQKSLNDAIYKGRQLLEELLGILLRLRYHPILLLADLEKAYHQISLKSTDRDYVRCLWLHDINSPPTENNIRQYRFTRIAFGVNASSFILAATLLYHLEHNKNEFTEKLKRDIYCDNLVTGTDTPEEAIRLVNTAINSFSSCSMNLRLWTTSSEEVRSAIPLEKRETKVEISLLGLKYDSKKDTISIAKPKLFEGAPTLRSILKNTSRVFDPLGLIAPVVLRGKLLIQSIHQQNYEWDDELPDDLRKEWKSIQSDFTRISSIEITRFLETNSTTTLHVLTDASARGMGFAIYQRTEINNEVITHLIFAKARVTPSKKLTIPRLELLAASLAIRGLEFVLKHVGNTPQNKITLWCDSKCTIARIYSTKIFSTFEEHRLQEIRKTPNMIYRYIPSELNTADYASRGLSLDELIASPWFKGPDFLQLSSDKWPSFNITDFVNYDLNQKDEITTSHTAILPLLEPKICLFETLLQHYSSLSKLIRATTYWIKFIAQKVPKFLHQTALPPDNLHYAAIQLWIRHTQQTSFPDLINDLKNKKKNKLIVGLRIFEDSDNILRSAGRWKHAPVSIDERTPILLPKVKESKFVKLLILHYHEMNFHTGTTHTLTAIRKRYWILQARRSVYYVLKSCNRCKRFTARPYSQPTVSDIPEFRFRPHTTLFSTVGVDTTGPLIIQGEKRYILLVTCLTSRAISLETLMSLETVAVQLAFRRFKARRTSPELYYSDCAPQFETIEVLAKELSEQPIRWKYAPPGASWMSGIYERLVSPIKQALHRTFHGKSLSYDQFQTAVLEIETTINSRPLTYTGSENEPTPLTPNDLLQIKFQKDEKEPSPSDTDSTSRKKLILITKQAQSLLNTFWRIWITTYLQELRDKQKRDEYKFKKNTSPQNPAVGDVVLLSDALRKRNTWPLGCITELHISDDGQIRSATVRIANGHRLHRPIQALYPLEINDRDPENSFETNQQVSPAVNSSHNIQTSPSDDDEIVDIEVEEISSVDDDFEIDSIEVEIHDDNEPIIPTTQ